MQEYLIAAKKASQTRLNDLQKGAVLHGIADALINNMNQIIAQNKKDLAGRDDDRLLLTESRIRAIANDVRKVEKLPSPLRTLRTYQIQPGLMLEQTTVPLGVVGIIYESRPNVTVDAFSLCFMAGNACVLKGGKEAFNTNQYLVNLIRHVLAECGLSPNFCILLNVDREHIDELLTADQYIDVLIPRGGKNLINYVRKHATIPVIETGAGVVHAYIDEKVDCDIAKTVLANSKLRRVSVCNALDCILIHRARLQNLPNMLEDIRGKATIYADPMSFEALEEFPMVEHASEEHYGYEFLDYKLSIKTVNNVLEAIDHINAHSSHHSETILSTDPYNITQFQDKVDSSTIYVNASTAFTDGGQFGLGAEIGISTQKLHARGPMGLEALTATKYIVTGNGNIRE